MDDREILHTIGKLVDEEHKLLRLESEGILSDPQHERMRVLEVSLDQCWDLLRQRRARRAAGQDPDQATARDPEVVEHYVQ